MMSLQGGKVKSVGAKTVKIQDTVSTGENKKLTTGTNSHNSKSSARKGATTLPAVSTSKNSSPESKKHNNAVAHTIEKLPMITDAVAAPPSTEAAADSDATADAIISKSEEITKLELLNDSTETVVLLAGTVAVAEEPSNNASFQPPVDEVNLAATTIPVEIKNNGYVRLIYNQYNEQFPIKNGSTTQAEIDEMYGLSFVMPNCLIHLSRHPPEIHRVLIIEEKFEELYIDEDPKGVYQGLVDDEVYYVYVEEEAEQKARDEAIMRQRLKQSEDPVLTNKADKRDDGRVLETCSCIYGAPCIDEYGCKDWTNRFAIAKQNGWKGF